MQGSNLTHEVASMIESIKENKDMLDRNRARSLTPEEVQSISTAQYKKCPLLALANALSDRVVNKSVKCTPACSFFIEEFGMCAFVSIAKHLGGKV